MKISQLTIGISALRGSLLQTLTTLYAEVLDGEPIGYFPGTSEFIEFTLTEPPYAGTYNTTGVPAMNYSNLAAGNVVYAIPPIVTSTGTGDGDVITGVPGFPVYFGADPGDQVFEFYKDGSPTGVFGLTWTIDIDLDGDAVITLVDTMAGASSTSNGITVDAAPAFSPADLTTQLFLQPSDATTRYQENPPVNLAVGTDPVGYIADKSGNARHIEATGTERPTVNAQGILFDGSNDVMRTATAVPGGFGSDVSIFICVDLRGDDIGVLLSDDANQYIGNYENAANNPNYLAGSPTTYVDGALVTTSAELRTALLDSEATAPVVEIRNANLSGWDHVNLGGYTFAGYHLLGTVFSKVILDTTQITGTVRADMIAWMKADAA